MNCHEAREGFSHRGMGLTERALVHAHVMQCVECRKERESLPQAVSSRPRVEPSRAAWLTRLRVLLSISLTRSGQVAVRVVEVLAILFTLSVRAAAHLIGRVRFVITRFAHLLIGLRSSVLITFRGSARAAIEAAGAGATRGLDVLRQLRVPLAIASTVSSQAAVRVVEVARLSVRAAAHLIGRVRFVITRFAHLLIGLRSSVLIAFRGSARAGIEAAGAGATRGLDLLRQLRVPLAIASTVASQAAVRVVEVARLSVQAAAHLIGRVRFVITRFTHLLIGLRSSVLITFQGSARAAIEAAGAGVTRGLDLLPRLSVLVSIFSSVSRQALVRVAWLVDRFTQVRWLLPFQGIARAATEAARAGVTRGLDLLPRLRQTKDAAWTTRSLLRVCTAIVSLAVLVAVILFSAGERLSQDVRLPADGKPTLAETSTLNPVSAPQPAPMEVSQPETPRASMRPKLPETQAEVPAPLRRPDPAFAQRRATASAPVPSTETAQNAEASDPTAAIDWLLKGGSSRRRIENP